MPPAAKIKPEQANLHGDEGLPSGVSGFNMPDGVRRLAQRVGAGNDTARIWYSRARV